MVAPTINEPLAIFTLELVSIANALVDVPIIISNGVALVELVNECNLLVVPDLVSCERVPLDVPSPTYILDASNPVDPFTITLPLKLASPVLEIFNLSVLPPPLVLVANERYPS